MLLKVIFLPISEIDEGCVDKFVKTNKLREGLKRVVGILQNLDKRGGRQNAEIH